MPGGDMSSVPHELTPYMSRDVKSRRAMRSASKSWYMSHRWCPDQKTLERLGRATATCARVLLLQTGFLALNTGSVVGQRWGRRHCIRLEALPDLVANIPSKCLTQFTHQGGDLAAQLLHNHIFELIKVTVLDGRLFDGRLFDGRLLGGGGGQGRRLAYQ